MPLLKGRIRQNIVGCLERGVSIHPVNDGAAVKYIYRYVAVCADASTTYQYKSFASNVGLIWVHDPSIMSLVVGKSAA